MPEEYTPKQRAYLAALEKHCADVADQIAYTLRESHGVTLTPEAEQHVARVVSLFVPEGTNLMLREAGLLPPNNELRNASQ